MDCCEGDLWDDVFWRYDFFEIRTRIQLKFGQMNATLLSQHNSMVQIMNQVLGGSSKNSDPMPGGAVGVDITGGVDRAVVNINQMLNFG